MAIEHEVRIKGGRGYRATLDDIGEMLRELAQAGVPGSAVVCARVDWHGQVKQIWAADEPVLEDPVQMVDDEAVRVLPPGEVATRPQAKLQPRGARHAAK